MDLKACTITVDGSKMRRVRATNIGASMLITKRGECHVGRVLLQLILAMGVRPLRLECHGQVIIENYEVGRIVERIEQKV